MSKAEYTVADLYEENASLRQRAERAERILAALRERVRALHEPIAKDIPKCVTCKDYAGYHVDLPCPTLRALEGTP